MGSAIRAKRALLILLRIMPDPKQELSMQQPMLDFSAFSSHRNLALLTVELPDTDQGIVEQNHGRPLITFTRFSNLPFEIRLLIWEFALPGGRCVDLTAYNVDHNKNNHLPVTLNINAESRKLALSHYGVFFQEPKFFRRAFAIDPIVDTVTIEFWVIQEENIQALYAQNPGLFNKIKFIEVRDTDYCGMAEDDGGLRESQEIIPWLFANFLGLPKVHFVDSRISHWLGAFYVDKYHDLISQAGILKSGGTSRQSGLDVKFLSHRRKNARPDCDQIDDATVLHPEEDTEQMED
ncbi:uncharacterized protein RAG0_03474 [Rhynchosporium agropyri]|uniref:2EXR domain-containing protein n=1 Tax=Rhynchosporium agropyri TaxID=914238 RepID=A0A1E1K529_9HELO|nr:uncharacterized protein RAG0_03474 [Rhynchosporium agropyri]